MINFECKNMYEKEWIKDKLEQIIPNKKFILKKQEYTVIEMYNKFKSEINKIVTKNNIYDYNFLNQKCQSIFIHGNSFDKSCLNEKYNYKQTREILMQWINEMIYEELQDDCPCDSCRLDRLMFEIDNYIPPEEYPDWDGDESIMYYLDHYVEEDDDDDDDEYDEEWEDM